MTFLRRIIKTGWQGFKRNALVSSAAILILFVTVSLITATILFNVLSMRVIESLKEKVSVGVYFLTNAPENEILQLKSRLTALSQIKSVEYISRTEALKRFRESHKGDEVINEALDQLGGQNPLPASLTIKASDPGHYENIVQFVEKSEYTNIIDHVDYTKRQRSIENMARISSNVSQAAIGGIILMGLISFLVSFNTLRLAIHNDRHKISIMRLVGASNNFVRGPFLVQGLLYGCISGFFSLLFWAIIMQLLKVRIEGYFAGLGPIKLAAYYSNHWLWFLGLQLTSGIFIGVISSIIAVRRHLDV